MPVALVSRMLLVGLGILLAFLFLGCSPAPQPQGQLPLARPGENIWTTVPMTGGPSVWTACVKGNRLYAMDSLMWRANDWTATGAKTLTAVTGC